MYHLGNQVHDAPVKTSAALGALLLLGSLAFIHLTAIPPFEDEGTQLRWIGRVLEKGEWLAPLQYGKPLEVWPVVPLVRLGLQPLVATRALHVFAGMIGAVLTYLVALRLGERRVAFVSGALFALCPFVVYLQRFALSEMFLCTAGVAFLVSAIRLLESPTGLRASVSAATLVLAVFCKMPVGLVFLSSIPLALVLMPPSERRSLLLWPALAKLIAAHTPAVLLGLAMTVAAVVRWRHGQSLGFGLDDLMCKGIRDCADVGAAIGVARPKLLEELATQLSVAATAVGLIGVLASALLGDWRRRWLIAVGALPMLAIGLLAGFWYSRYLLFTLPPLITASVSGWRLLAGRTGRFHWPLEIAVLTLCVTLFARQSARLILDPLAARWSPADRFQYFEGWSSGYGFPEAAQLIRTSAEAPSHIYSLDGHSAEQLRNYLPVSWRHRVKPIFYGDDGQELRSDAARLQGLLEHAPAWIIISEPLLQGYLDSTLGRANLNHIHLHRVVSFDKPGLRVQLTIYQVSAATD
jgi:hypothetical protein